VTYVVAERRDPALWLELRTGAPKNALSCGAVRALSEALDAVGDGVRAVVLHSRQAEFSAGWDLNDTASTEDSLRLVFELNDRIAALPVPVLVAVDGLAIGGSVGLVAACDLVIATTSAGFGMPEARVGMVGAIAGTTIAERLGPRALGRLLIRGDRLDAAAAAQLGLVDLVVPPTELADAVATAVDDICRGGPASVAAAKRFARAAVPPNAALRELAIELTQELADGPEVREGTQAFFERRPPRW
jgi:methylglutaconyl-CoA hydratase